MTVIGKKHSPGSAPSPSTRWFKLLVGEGGSRGVVVGGAWENVSHLTGNGALSAGTGKEGHGPTERLPRRFAGSSLGLDDDSLIQAKVGGVFMNTH